MEELKYVDYSNKYYKQLFNLQVGQWGEGSDSDEIFENIDKYSIKLVLDKTTLYLDMIVLDSKYQNKGIGTKLMKDFVEFAKQNNYKKLECSAVEANGHTNSKKLLENFGFDCVESVEGYWGKLCPDFYCTECGQKPCICNMHKYIKKL